MIERIKIRNFKCFDELEMSNLAPVTIIGGKNNVGKSTVLESILIQFVMINPTYFAFLMNLHNDIMQNNSSADRVWEHLFYNLNESDDFSIEYERPIYSHDKLKADKSKLVVSKLYDNMNIFQKNETQTLLKQGYDSANIKKRYSAIHIEYQSESYTFSGKCIVKGGNVEFSPDEKYISLGNMPSGYSYPEWKFENIIIFKNTASISPIVEWLSKTVLENDKRKMLIKMLNLFDKDIVAVSPVIESGYANIIVTVKPDNCPEKHIAMSYMGDGINKAFQLLLTILNLRNGIFLIDEFENGLYYELYEDVLSVIFEAALSVNCQLIMTTHSRDLVEASLVSMKKMERTDALCYQRIDRTKDRHYKSYIIKGEDLDVPFETGLEIR